MCACQRDKELSPEEMREVYLKVRKYVWMIEVVKLDNRGRKARSKFCGGVCMHEKGIILTAASTFSEVSTENSSGFKFKGWVDYNMGRYWCLELLEADHYNNLALLYVRDSTENFGYATFSEHLDTFCGQQVFCVQHPSHMPFVLGIGTVASPTYDGSCSTSCRESFESQITNPQRKVSNLKSSWLSYGKDFIGDKELQKDLEFVMKNSSDDLSLIQITKLAKWTAGNFGCPVFETTGKVVGLLAYSQGSFSYAITLRTMKDCCKGEKQIVGLGTITLVGDDTKQEAEFQNCPAEG